MQLQINLRVPYWANGGSVKINGAELPAFGVSTAPSLQRIKRQAAVVGARVGVQLQPWTCVPQPQHSPMVS